MMFLDFEQKLNLLDLKENVKVKPSLEILEISIFFCITEV